MTITISGFRRVEPASRPPEPQTVTAPTRTSGASPKEGVAVFTAQHNQNVLTAMSSMAPMAPVAPMGDHNAWRELPCRVEDPELWFAESPADVEWAKALCRECPFVATCLEGALERREPWGVWGGELLVAGEVVARKRPRGRPRKDSVAA